MLKRLSRTMILDNVWGYTPERYVDSRIVDVHISGLRSKLEEEINPDLIQIARGKSCMFRCTKLYLLFKLTNTLIFLAH